MRLLAIASTVKKTLFGVFRAIRSDDDGRIEVVQPTGGSFDVFVQDQTSRPFLLYLYQTVATPSLTVDSAIDDDEISVDSNVGVVNNHAITIYEDDRIFQSLVESSTANSIKLQSNLDFAFTTNCVIECGPWNMNVDGSVIPQIFSIHPPIGSDFDVYTIMVSITDDAAMDSDKFGGIAKLLKGFVLRHVNGERLNLGLFVNNLGFGEAGFDIFYDDKAPAGVYGVRFKKNIHEINGVAVRLHGSEGDMIQAINSVNLSALSGINVTICGHMVVN